MIVVGIMFILLAIGFIYTGMTEREEGVPVELTYGSQASILLLFGIWSVLCHYDRIHITESNVWLYMIASMISFFVIMLIISCIITLFQWGKESKEKRT